MCKIINKKILYLFINLYFCSILHNSTSDIVVRKAVYDDLPLLFELDKVVSYEYFLPMYINEYGHLPLGKNAQYYIDLELKEDKQWFTDCIEEKALESLWVASDKTNGKISGLIIAHQNSTTTMLIDLLLILKESRKQGVGRKLVKHAIDSFPKVYLCEVYPLKFGNNGTLAFYQSLGFINHGIPEIDKINLYGISYKDMYYYFTYQIRSPYTSRSRGIR